jgi:hypothetical protein
LANPGGHHAASSRTPNQNSKVLLLLQLAYDFTQTWHEPRKHLVVIWWIEFLNFRLVFCRTAKNRLISRFSLFKVLLLLGNISECSINMGKEGEICFCYFDELKFWNVLFNSRESHFSNRKWKLENKSRGI